MLPATSVADPDPEGSETFGRIRIRFGTEINVSDPKTICKKEHYFQAEISWFHMIIHISHLQVVATIAVLYTRKHLQVVVRSVVDP